MRRDCERCRPGIKATLLRRLGRLAQIILEATRTPRPLLALTLIAFGDLFDPLLMIVVERDKIDAVRLGETPRRVEAAHILLLCINVRVRKEERRLVTFLFQARQRATCTRTATGMKKNAHKKTILKN